MLSQNIYINQNESQRIIKFFDKSIKSKLSESDQKIGQIQFLKKLIPSVKYFLDDFWVYKKYVIYENS